MQVSASPLSHSEAALTPVGTPHNTCAKWPLVAQTKVIVSLEIG